MKRKRIIICVSIAIPCILLAIFLLHGKVERLYFLKKWSTRLSSYKSLGDIKEKEYEVIRHEFPDKSWVAFVFSSKCCVGDSFRAILLRDEKGNLYINNEFDICGYESSGELFRNIEANNSEEFIKNSSKYQNLKFIKY